MPISRVIWHLTNRCNLRCSYCYVSAGTHESELSRDEALAVAKQINDLELSDLSLTGGEPTMFRHFDEVIASLRRDIPKGLNTNGTTLTPSLITRLASAGFERVTISIDSIQQYLNDLTRGNNSYPSILRGLKLALDAGLWVAVPIQVSQLNAGSLAETMLRLAELGVQSVKINFVEDLGYAIGKRLSLSVEERATLLRTISPTISQTRETHGVDVSAESSIPFPEFFEAFGEVACYCGHHRAMIKHDGGVVPCDAMDYPGGYIELGYPILKVPEHPLVEIFEESELFSVYRDATGFYRPRGCEGCRFYPPCRGGCRSRALLLARSLFVRTPLCYKGPFAEEPPARVREPGQT